MNRALFTVMLAAAVAAPAAVSAQARAYGINDIIKNLQSLPVYEANARFTVSMPQLANDVIYDVSLLQQSTAAEDPLSCNAYLIEWQADESDGNNSAPKGFAAYCDGHHFRFGGERLLEYHLQYDSIPFRPDIIGSRSEGVHRTPQFFALLPQAIAEELRSICADSSYRAVFRPDTIISGRHVSAIDAVMTRNGAVAMEAEYVFDPATSLPLRVSLENNPGSISEQTVITEYRASSTHDSTAPITEQWLVSRFPSEFERYRQNSFSLENLSGQHLPAFSLPTTTGERYSRRGTDRFPRPTIVALLEAGGNFTPATVEALRDAAARLTFDADIIWAFTDNLTDPIEEIIPSILPGEHLLKSARSLARDCGASAFPVVILTGSDGIVKNVIIGYNNDLTSDVIQKMTIMD